MGSDSALSKLLPAGPAPCPHVLARWFLRTAKSTVTRADGSTRPDGQRGGRLVRTGDGCVFKPGHQGAHRADNGRSWT